MFVPFDMIFSELNVDIFHIPVLHFPYFQNLVYPAPQYFQYRHFDVTLIGINIHLATPKTLRILISQLMSSRIIKISLIGYIYFIGSVIGSVIEKDEYSLVKKNSTSLKIL